jgi:dTDP-4-dehydrorhamnose 3,5-epimerase
MKIVETSLSGVLLIDTTWHGDNRGSFAEVHNQREFAEFGIPPMVQTNESYSVGRVLRGLHLQTGQGKLVRCLVGAVFDVVVDASSGKHEVFQLDGSDDTQIYIPPGYLHGFQTYLAGCARVLYSCTTHYEPANEFTVVWNDPDIGIDWPITEPILSERDASAGSLRELQEAMKP